MVHKIEEKRWRWKESGAGGGGGIRKSDRGRLEMEKGDAVKDGEGGRGHVERMGEGEKTRGGMERRVSSVGRVDLGGDMEGMGRRCHGGSCVGGDSAGGTSGGRRMVLDASGKEHGTKSVGRGMSSQDRF